MTNRTQSLSKSTQKNGQIFFATHFHKSKLQTYIAIYEIWAQKDYTSEGLINDNYNRHYNKMTNFVSR